jgi:hypothetical protein
MQCRARRRRMLRGRDTVKDNGAGPTRHLEAQATV